MGVVINAVKARVALIAIVNAVGLVLSGLGKISQETLSLWAEQTGNIFDWCVLIFGSVALLLPGINQFVRVDKDTAGKVGMLLVAVCLSSMVAACGKNTPVVTGPVCVDTQNGRICYLPGAEPTPVAAPALEK